MTKSVFYSKIRANQKNLASTLTYIVKGENKKMKKYKLEQFLQDPQADIGTGLLVTRGFGFCFTLKDPSRWGKTQDGLPQLIFGGIGGKLEQDELPGDSLHRETIEEVGSDVKIVRYSEKTILMDSNSIEEISLSTDIPNEPLPFIIFRSPRGEVGRKPFTNILIYIGEFVSSSIRPIDDPAIIELDESLLLRLAEESISLEEFKQAGGRITSRIELPDYGILKPIGTAIAIVRCLQIGIVNSIIPK